MEETGHDWEHGCSLDIIPPWIGCDRYNCSVCGVIGVKPAPRELAVLVKKVGIMEDLEQVFTMSVASRRYRTVVEAAGLTGMEFRNVREFHPANDDPDLIEFAAKCAAEYKAVWVHGNGGSIARTCGVRVNNHCEVCGWIDWTLSEVGIIVDPEEWDGSDFFQIKELPGPTFMSQRAYDVIANAGLSNVTAIPAEEHFPDPFARKGKK